MIDICKNRKCLCKMCKFNEEVTGIKSMNACSRCKECVNGSKEIEDCGMYKRSLKKR